MSDFTAAHIVNDKLKVELSGSEVEDVILHNAATSLGNGTAYTPAKSENVTLTFEITGTNTARTLLFECAGLSGVFKPCTCFNVADPTKFGTSTTEGNDASPDSWQVDIPFGWSFRVRSTSFTGGNLTVKGKAV